jgi:translation initiation factor IF-2
VGLVIEAHLDKRRGNTATLIVQDGTVVSGEFVVSGASMAPVRIMENFLGKPIKSAGPGTPIGIVGFSTLPQVGMSFKTVESKKEAEADVAEAAAASRNTNTTASASDDERVVLPLIIKTDVAGTGEAVMHELDKVPKDDRLEVRVVNRAVGTISEADVKLMAGSSMPGIIVGFNVGVEASARDLAERQGVTIQTFDIIYKLAEWLTSELEVRRPRVATAVVLGEAKVLKFFSAAKGRVVLGGRVENGVLKDNAEVRIMRRDLELGMGKITSLQSQKREVKEVEAGTEFGAQLKTDVEPAPGDRLEAFIIENK